MPAIIVACLIFGAACFYNNNEITIVARSISLVCVCRRIRNKAATVDFGQLFN